MWKLLLLGVIQGTTEFFPVSSSGHLALGEWLLGAQIAGARGAATEIALHLGTLVAVTVFVWRDLVGMTRALFLPRSTSDGAAQRALFVRVVIATIPAAVFGVLLRDEIEATFDNRRLIGAGFLLTALILILSRRVDGHHRRAEQLPLTFAFLVGLAQTVALLPGVSRSGSTIVAALACGLAPLEAGRFSFLMALPVTAGAIALDASAILHVAPDGRHAIAAGVVASFVAGLLALRYLTILLRRRGLAAFSWYLIPLGLLVLAFGAGGNVP